MSPAQRLFVITNLLILGYYVNQDNRGTNFMAYLQTVPAVKYQVQGSFWWHDSVPDVALTVCSYVWNGNVWKKREDLGDELPGTFSTWYEGSLLLEVLLIKNYFID